MSVITKKGKWYKFGTWGFLKECNQMKAAVCMGGSEKKMWSMWSSLVPLTCRLTCRPDLQQLNTSGTFSSVQRVWSALRQRCSCCHGNMGKLWRWWDRASTTGLHQQNQVYSDQWDVNGHGVWFREQTYRISVNEFQIKLAESGHFESKWSKS